MVRKKFKTVPHRRKHEGKTNYKKRLRFITSGKPRLVIRKSLKNIIIQVIGYKEGGDDILVETRSRELKTLGWNYSKNSTSASYLIGYLAAKKAVKKNVTDAVVDIGNYPSTKGSCLYAAVKGVIDGGLQVNCDESMFPSEDRINGKHIEEYAKKLSIDDEKRYAKTYSQYTKTGADPKTISQSFNTVKEKIDGQK